MLEDIYITFSVDHAFANLYAHVTTTNAGNAIRTIYVEHFDQKDGPGTVGPSNKDYASLLERALGTLAIALRASEEDREEDVEESRIESNAGQNERLYGDDACTCEDPQSCDACDDEELEDRGVSNVLVALDAAFGGNMESLDTYLTDEGEISSFTVHFKQP